MNNKVLGNSFEMEFVNLLGENGFWAHFIEPNKSGAQPFDVIAYKDGKMWVFDCKTCANNRITWGRLQTNQILALNKVMDLGCQNTYIAVKHNDEIHLVHYKVLEMLRSVKLDGTNLFKQIIY